MKRSIRKGIKKYPKSSLAGKMYRGIAKRDRTQKKDYGNFLSSVFSFKGK